MWFTKLEIRKEILSALEKLGYTTPTNIQQLVINASQLWKNIIWQSQTWTGKTAAFVIPLLNKIDPNLKKVQALILAPTRELALQIREEIYNLSKELNIRSLAVYGGSSIFEQKKVLMKGPQIVVWTPWRVIDLIERWILKLGWIEYFILDEVDRMLDMWFIEDIDYIWNSLKTLKQVMTFSATITSELKNIITKYLGDNYEFIKATTEVVVDKIDHSFMNIHEDQKYDLLKKYLNLHKEDKIIIFTQTKHWASNLQDMLDQDGFKVWALHGDMTQRNRFDVLKKYKWDSIRILVATDVAARWLNMNDINLVVNFEVPTDPESYVHRIWRTARAGKSGKAIMFVARHEGRALLNIERTNKIKLKKVNEEWVEQPRLETSKSSGWRGGYATKFGSSNGRGWRSERRWGYSSRSRGEWRSEFRSSDSRWEGRWESRGYRSDFRSEGRSEWRSYRSDSRSDRGSSRWYGRSEGRRSWSSNGKTSFRGRK